MPEKQNMCLFLAQRTVQLRTYVIVNFIVNTTQQQIYILEKLVIENLNFQQRSSGKYKYIFHTHDLCNTAKPQVPSALANSQKSSACKLWQSHNSGKQTLIMSHLGHDSVE